MSNGNSNINVNVNANAENSLVENELNDIMINSSNMEESKDANSMMAANGDLVDENGDVKNSEPELELVPESQAAQEPEKEDEEEPENKILAKIGAGILLVISIVAYVMLFMGFGFDMEADNIDNRYKPLSGWLLAIAFTTGSSSIIRFVKTMTDNGVINTITYIGAFLLNLLIVAGVAYVN